MKALLRETIVADLMVRARKQAANQTSDIRNYDDKSLFAVTGTSPALLTVTISCSVSGFSPS